MLVSNIPDVSWRSVLCVDSLCLQIFPLAEKTSGSSLESSAMPLYTRQGTRHWGPLLRCSDGSEASSQCGTWKQTNQHCLTQPSCPALPISLGGPTQTSKSVFKETCADTIALRLSPFGGECVCITSIVWFLTGSYSAQRHLIALAGTQAVLRC